MLLISFKITSYTLHPTPYTSPFPLGEGRGEASYTLHPTPYTSPFPLGEGRGEASLFYRLISGDHYHLHDVLHFASAAQVVHRSGYALQDGSYSICAGETLY